MKLYTVNIELMIVDSKSKVKNKVHSAQILRVFEGEKDAVKFYRRFAKTKRHSSLKLLQKLFKL